MKYNYHTHTYRCKHAGGTEREYVEEAIQAGIRQLGFADHAPMPFPKSYDPPTKMAMEELEGYVTTILDLKAEYQKDIDIRLGLEAEYYPTYWDGFLKETSQYPIEYLILGQHFPGDEIGEQWCGMQTDDDSMLIRYVEQVIRGLETGKFLYLAHPDLIFYTGDTELYKTEMRKLVKACIRLQIPLEINFLGILTHRNYPNPVFWEIAGQEKAKAVFGLDAHQARDIYQPESEKIAREMVKKYQLDLIEKALL